MDLGSILHLTTGNINLGNTIKFNNLLALKKGLLMFEEYEKKKRKDISLMRSLLDYGMGVVILLAGLFFFFRNKFSITLNEKFPPNDMDKIFGVICMVYGCWRIYRGYQKKYFR